MVEEGEEMAAFSLCSCSSTFFWLEQGLEGTLTDLRWDAMVVMEVDAPFSSLGMEEEKQREAVLQWC